MERNYQLELDIHPSAGSMVFQQHYIVLLDREAGTRSDYHFDNVIEAIAFAQYHKQDLFQLALVFGHTRIVFTYGAILTSIDLHIYDDRVVYDTTVPFYTLTRNSGDKVTTHVGDIGYIVANVLQGAANQEGMRLVARSGEMVEVVDIVSHFVIDYHRKDDDEDENEETSV